MPILHIVSYASHKINVQYIYFEVNIMAVKSFSIRIEEEMLKKIAFVADYEGRSTNSHILVLIRKSIKEFEAEHGDIDEDIRADSNVKPARRK